MTSGKEILNQLRKLYVGSLEDEEEKAAMMTPEEIAKVWLKIIIERDAS